MEFINPYFVMSFMERAILTHRRSQRGHAPSGYFFETCSHFVLSEAVSQ